MNIKLVALDMDGTLLNSKKELPADFIPWVRSHPDIKTVIASGRQYYTLEKDFLPIRDNLLFIAENGGFVFEHGKIIYENAMKTDDIAKCLRLINTVPCATPIVCGAKAAYLFSAGKEALYNAAMYYESRENTNDPIAAAKSDTIVKIAIFFKDKSAEKYMEYFKDAGEGLKAVLSGDSWIDIANSSVNKGAAIRSILEKYNIPAAEAMAFGDYLNDYDLLKSCGESYCMANGHPELKALAKHIAPSNDDDGVMRILRTL